jgi:hypothetical protein
MADRTGTAVLLSQLESLCLEFRAYKHIAKNSREPERCAVFLNNYKRENQAQVYSLFDAVNAALHNGENDTAIIRLLSGALLEATG